MPCLRMVADSFPAPEVGDVALVKERASTCEGTLAPSSEAVAPPRRDYGKATMKYLRAAIPVVGMATLLEERKATLQAMVRDRFRSAREDGTVADVKALSTAIRAVKRQLVAAR